MEIWAHRGASDSAPENTLQAFQVAINKNAYGIELDIQLTKDGEIVVIHDDKIDRTCNGTGFVKDYTFAQIRTFNAGHTDTFNPIPTLAEVFEMVKPTPLKINVEFKTDTFFYEGIEEKALVLAEKQGIADRIIWSSFNHHAIKRIKQINPSINAALLSTGGVIITASQCISLGASSMHANIRQLKAHPYIQDDCKQNDVKLRVWTVDATEDLEFIVKKNIDGVFTNKLDTAGAIIK